MGRISVTRLQEVTGYAEVHGDAEAAEKYGISIETIPRYRRMLKKAEGVQYADRKIASSEDVENYIDIIKQMQQATVKLDEKHLKISLSIHTDKWVGIAFSGDWHIGSFGTDLNKLERDLQVMSETENLYVIGMGDYKENQMPSVHPSGVYEQVLPPGGQDIVVKRYIEKYGDLFLALIRGCHDDWDKQQGDKDFAQELADMADCPNMWHGGDMFLTVGNQPYHLKVRHKFPYNSSLNPANAMRRLMELQGPCDIAFYAHLHNPFLMQRQIMGEERILGRSGTYKTLDEYGQKLGGLKGVYGVPVVLLNPNKRQMIGFQDLESGISVLNALNGSQTIQEEAHA